MTHPPGTLSRALAVLMTAGALALLPVAAYADPPIAGPQTSGDTQFPNVGNGGYDVSSYAINMVWTPATVPGVTDDQSIVSTTTITAATTGAPLSSFSLDLEGLTVDTVKVDNVTAPFTRVQTPAITKYKLVITPATPVSGTFTTVVTYHGTPVAHEDADGTMEGWNATSDGATFVNQPIGSMTGFPNNNTPADKATYTYTLSVPTTINAGASAAVANGVLTSKTAIAGSRTQWVWTVAKPMASELALISIGRYDMSTSDIVLANGLGTVKEWSFVDPTTSAATSFATTRGKIKPVLDFLSARYGTYPANATGIVVDNVTGLGISYALETQDRPFFPGSVGDSTLTHELMHQWFGDNVSPSFWSDLWLNEGPATYAEDQYASESTTETTYYNDWNGTAASSATWTTPAANPTDNDPSDLFGDNSDGHVYARGAMALEALRTVVGPTQFLAIMKEWQVRYGTQSKGTEDFFALAEELSGKELTAFFQDWIYDADKPAWPGKFNLSLASSPASGSVPPGGPFSYTLSAPNTGKVTLTGAVVKVDLSGVLDDATIGTLPANTSLNGATLTWSIPSTVTSSTATAVVPFTVKPDASGTMTAVASVPATTLGGTCLTCTSTLGAGLDPVSPAPDPTITGTPKVGQTLTADTTGWASGTSFAYVWKRDGTSIPGATAPTYPLVAADLGGTITVQVTGSKAGFSDVSRTSAATTTVVAGDQASTPTPTVTGTPKVGETLTAVPGSWDPGVALAYQWAANGTDISGASATTYGPAAADIGKTITVKVTGTRAGYTTVSKASNPTAAVVAGTQTATPTPTITGTPKLGHELTAVPGTWDPGVMLTYQWQADGTAIGGASDPTFTPAPNQVGAAITVAVTGTRSGYTTVTKTSEPTSLVAPGDQASTPTPTISGPPKVGSTLTAVPGSWDPGVTLTYQWKADDASITSAVGTTYTPTPGDVGRTISVTVTGTRSGYSTVSRTSAPTPPVAKGKLARGPVPVITGKAKVGRTLTAKPGTWATGVTLTYQWYVGRLAVAGATSPTFKLKRAAQGQKVRVRVTGSKPGYDPRTMTSRKTAVVV